MECGIKSCTKPVVWRSRKKKSRRTCKRSDFDSLSGQIGLSVTNGSPPLRRFLGFVLPMHLVTEMDPATRYTLRRNSASKVKLNQVSREESVHLH